MIGVAFCCWTSTYPVCPVHRGLKRAKKAISAVKKHFWAPVGPGQQRQVSRNREVGVLSRKQAYGIVLPYLNCEYYGITDETIHALDEYGGHGKHKLIQDLKCQACRKKFTVRKKTVRYRLKTRSGLVEIVMWLLALGVDASAIEEVFGMREITIRTWLSRSGMQGKSFMIGSCSNWI
jgi:hypothetical protein